MSGLCIGIKQDGDEVITNIGCPALVQYPVASGIGDTGRLWYPGEAGHARKSNSGAYQAGKEMQDLS
jgi:hypothetical protein